LVHVGTTKITETSSFKDFFLFNYDGY